MMASRIALEELRCGGVEAARLVGTVKALGVVLGRRLLGHHDPFAAGWLKPQRFKTYSQNFFIAAAPCDLLECGRAQDAA